VIVAPGAAPRLRGLLRTEWRLLLRMWVIASAVIVTVLWSVAVLFIPASARPVVVPLILLMDLAALGFFFIPSLVVLERAEGVSAALRVTMARPGERLAVRAGLLTVASLVAAFALLLAAGHGPVLTVLAGVAATSLTFALLAYTMVGPFETLTAYMVRVPMVAVPLLLPALVTHLGIWDAWPAYLSPVTGQLELMSGRLSWIQVAWQVGWIWMLWILATRAVVSPVRPAPASAVVGKPGQPLADAPYSRWRAIRSFATADRVTLLRDPLLVLIVAGVPAVALAARLLSWGGIGWIRDRFGLDVTPYLPVAWGMLLVLHTPLMFGSIAGLLFLEDRDARLNPVIATTRASTETLLAYRLGALVVATAVMLPIGFAIAGVSHPAGWIGLAATVVAGAALAPLPAMAMAALAPNRAAGMALMKGIGLPLYLPLASWFVGFPAAIGFGIIPSAWPLWALWSDSAAASVATAVIGVVVSAAACWLLGRRRLTG
jgi:fluoroquinolone transport system permease protein